eukprot:210949-Prymnesium_polylepis.1
MRRRLRAPPKKHDPTVGRQQHRLAAESAREVRVRVGVRIGARALERGKVLGPDPVRPDVLLVPREPDLKADQTARRLPPDPAQPKLALVEELGAAGELGAPNVVDSAVGRVRAPVVSALKGDSDRRLRHAGERGPCQREERREGRIRLGGPRFAARAAPASEENDQHGERERARSCGQRQLARGERHDDFTAVPYDITSR